VTRPAWRLAAAPEGKDERRTEASAPSISGAAFLATGTAGNAAMAVAGALLGDYNGLDVSRQLLHTAPNLPAALAYMLPLLGGCYWAVSAADEVEGFGAIRGLFKQTLIPQLQSLPGWVSPQYVLHACIIRMYDSAYCHPSSPRCTASGCALPQ
jgi:hypothetical protein